MVAKNYLEGRYKDNRAKLSSVGMWHGATALGGSLGCLDQAGDGIFPGERTARWQGCSIIGG